MIPYTNYRLSLLTTESWKESCTKVSTYVSKGLQIFEHFLE